MDASTRNRLEAAVAEITGNHDRETVSEMFCERNAQWDLWFWEVGRIALDGRDISNIPRHIIVWTGYEWVKGNVYAGKLMEEFE
jgi:hypothetical protein